MVFAQRLELEQAQKREAIKQFVQLITPREAARLQGFPDWFEFQPTIWHSFRQIGNSVSPIVAEKILSVIFQKLT